MSESFGAWLRRERERRHIDLTSIAASTKVKLTLFEGLERDDVSKWPSGIFRRSFVRAYASAIGLNSDVVLREFQLRFPDPAGDIPETVRVRPSAQPPTERESDTVLRLTLADTPVPFSGGRLLAQARRRWAAVSWDTGVVLAIAVTLFAVVGEFWSSLGISMICYYAGGILILGNTPGVCLFAPRHAEDEEAASPTPARDVTSDEPSLQTRSIIYAFKPARRAR